LLLLTVLIVDIDRIVVDSDSSTIVVDRWAVFVISMELKNKH
jgi:hypothetical protein